MACCSNARHDDADKPLEQAGACALGAVTLPRPPGIPSRARGCSATSDRFRRRLGPPLFLPDDGAFAAKLATWVALVDEAVAARTANAARRAYEKGDGLDHLPIDL